MLDMNSKINRRQFLGMSALAATGAVCAQRGSSFAAAAVTQAPALATKADSMILIWLPGGIAQADMWDPKPHTPFRAGMKGSELLSTCGSMPTAADGVTLAKGLDHLAAVMDRGTILRTVVGGARSGVDHLRAQYRMMTGYEFPPAVKAPSLGAIIARTLGSRLAGVPPYFYIGRDATVSDWESRFVHESIGAGFYGSQYAPILISDPRNAASLFAPVGGAGSVRSDRRLSYLHGISALAAPEFRESAVVAEFLESMTDARRLMDSPAAKAMQYLTDEPPETVRDYEPEISQSVLFDKSYFHGVRFGHGLLLARRLVESGARFVQVEYPFARRKGFDTHENGSVRIAEMKRQIDRPMARLIRDLEKAGLLDRTIVAVASEFGRTVSYQAIESEEPETREGNPTGENLVVLNESMYGFHRHFGDCGSMLFYGGGFRKGFAYGKTADRHPMAPVENPVTLEDVYATILKSLGVPADRAFMENGRSFHVTPNGLGKPIDALFG